MTKSTTLVSNADKEPEARKASVLHKYSYLCEPSEWQRLHEMHGKAHPEMLEIFRDLVGMAIKYKRLTGRQLPILGELGELFAEISFGIKRHVPMAQGSDGVLGNDFVEVKTITPDKKGDCVRLKLAGHFSKVVVVKISEDFQFAARMVDRRMLEKNTNGWAKISWDAMIEGEEDLEFHRRFPIKQVPPKHQLVGE